MPRPENADAPLREQRGAEDNDAGMGKPQRKDNTLFHALWEAMHDPRLRASDWLAYGVLLKHERWGTSRPSRTRIAKEAGLHLGSIRRCTAKLEECGYITVVPQAGRATNVYRLDRLNGSAPDTGSAEATGSLHAVDGGSAQATSTGLTGSPQATSTDRRGSAQATQLLRAPHAAAFDLSSECEQVAASLVPAASESDSDGKFSEFWTAYPRKEAKPAARKAWGRHRLERLADRIIGDVQARIADPGQWIDRKFIPLPASYLNGRRWEDEWQPAAGKRAAGHIPRDQRSQEQIDRENEQALRQLEGRAA